MPYADPERQKEAKRLHAAKKYANDKRHRKEKKAASAAYYEEMSKDPTWRAEHSKRVLTYYVKADESPRLKTKGKKKSSPSRPDSRQRNSSRKRQTASR